MKDYRFTNRLYEPKIEDANIKPSTSADGWEYHKPNKKRKKK